MRRRIFSPRRAPSLRDFVRQAAVMAAVMTVAACVGNTEYWSPQEAPKENKITWITFSHTVGFASPASSLSKSDRAGINRFLDEIDVGDSDRVFIRARHGPDSHQVAAVAKHLRALRLRPEIIVARGAAHPVSVVIGRYLVTPPRCPDWTKQPGLDLANRRSSNFGCATTTNLGLMVADPGDLLHGAPLGPSDGVKSASTISIYRKGKIKKLPSITLDNQGGK